jgi:Mg/Co/Ni transporter MgtE
MAYLSPLGMAEFELRTAASSALRTRKILTSKPGDHPFSQSEQITMALAEGRHKRVRKMLQRMHPAKIAALLDISARHSDPVLAGRVILTSVTDVVGFFAFLGLATVFLI